MGVCKVICVYDSYFSNRMCNVSCVAFTRTRGRDLETSPKAIHLGKSGFKLAFEKKKKFLDS